MSSPSASIAARFGENLLRATTGCADAPGGELRPSRRANRGGRLVRQAEGGSGVSLASRGPRRNWRREASRSCGAPCGRIDRGRFNRPLGGQNPSIANDAKLKREPMHGALRALATFHAIFREHPQPPAACGGSGSTQSLPSATRTICPADPGTSQEIGLSPRMLGSLATARVATAIIAAPAINAASAPTAASIAAPSRYPNGTSPREPKWSNDPSRARTCGGV